MGKCGKGTGSFGLRHTKTHTLCRRCGRRSFHIQKVRTQPCSPAAAAAGSNAGEPMLPGWSPRASKISRAGVLLLGRSSRMPCVACCAAEHLRLVRLPRGQDPEV